MSRGHTWSRIRVRFHPRKARTPKHGSRVSHQQGRKGEGRQAFWAFRRGQRCSMLIDGSRVDHSVDLVRGGA